MIPEIESNNVLVAQHSGNAAIGCWPITEMYPNAADDRKPRSSWWAISGPDVLRQPVVTGEESITGVVVIRAVPIGQWPEGGSPLLASGDEVHVLDVIRAVQLPRPRRATGNLRDYLAGRHFQSQCGCGVDAKRNLIYGNCLIAGSAVVKVQ